MKTVSLCMPQNFICKLESFKNRVSDPNNEALELIRIYNGLISALNLAIQSIQAGGVGQVKRDENEDAESALEDLREFFSPSYLHSFIDDLDHILTFAEICKDAKFICDNLTRA